MLTDDGRSQRARMLAGEPYLASDPELQQLSHRAMRLTEHYNRTSVDDAQERHSILSDLLGGIGDEVVIRPPFYCDYGSHIHIGARTFANFNLIALDVAAITIGEDVQIGPNVQLLTPTRPIEPEPRRAKIEGAKPVTIGNNVWLGGGVIVCPGVSIGESTVVGAGAIVARDLPPECRCCWQPGARHSFGLTAISRPLSRADARRKNDHARELIGTDSLIARRVADSEERSATTNFVCRSPCLLALA